MLSIIIPPTEIRILPDLRFNFIRPKLVDVHVKHDIFFQLFPSFVCAKDGVKAEETLGFSKAVVGFIKIRRGVLTESPKRGSKNKIKPTTALLEIRWFERENLCSLDDITAKYARLES